MTLRLSSIALVLAGVILAQAPEYGPAKGTLVIQGGGDEDGTGIIETFISKAGGLNAKFVVVPTAAGNRTNDGKIREFSEQQILALWKKRGLTNVHMLHT